MFEKFAEFPLWGWILVALLLVAGVLLMAKMKDKSGKTFTVKADSVILSVGYNPAPVAEKAKHVHVIGDAAKVGNLRSVIWGAWDVCMKL